MSFNLKDLRIGVIGLGYVGLPLAVEFGKKYPTVGFDIKPGRIAALEAGNDTTLEVDREELDAATKLAYTSDPEALRRCNFFIVTVPTPLGPNNRPSTRAAEARERNPGRAHQAGRHRGVRIDRLPGRHGRVLRPDHRELLGAQVQPGLLRRLQPGAHQSRRQGSTGCRRSSR